MTVRQTLVALGVHSAPPPGPTSSYASPEEARRVKQLQSKARNAARRADEKARKAGADVPKRARGRPRKYTPDEALVVKRAQNRECRRRFHERIAVALEA